MTVYSLVVVMISFLQYPVITTVSLVSNTSLDFPTVTICNSNRVHCGRLAKLIQRCHGVRTLFFANNCARQHSYFVGKLQQIARLLHAF